MKKAAVVLVFATLAMVTLGLVSCVSMAPPPDFYQNPPTATDSIYGVGSARMSTLDLSRTAALARARDDIARQVEIAVRNAITDYAQQAGEGGNQQALNFTETISKQIANVTLQGVKTVKVQVNEDGMVYALVSYQISNLKIAAQDQFKRNEASAFAEFKATDALKALDTELANNPPKASSAPAGGGSGN